MKKFTFLALIAITATVFMVSCKGDDATTTDKPKPTVTWKTSAGFVFQNVTKGAGTSIDFGILATSASDQKITKVTVTLSVNGGTAAILWDSTMKVTSFSRDWMGILVGNLAGSQNKFTATVTQDNGESSSVTFTVSVTTPVRATQTNAAITLGAQNNSTVGSFFQPSLAATGVMLLSQANSNQANVHVIYYSGSTNKETFSSPNDAQVTQVFANISNWTVRNATQLRLTTKTAAQFDAIPDADAAIIDTECSGVGFTTRVTALKVGDVVAYRTQTSDHYALFKVTAISVGGAGSITFDMKNPAF